MSERDDFTPGTKLLLAERAAYRCSRCRRRTIEPKLSTPSGTIKTGRASHIHGAAPKGPRHNPHQTSEERRAFENGIWLCALCADVVDKDEVAFTPDRLRQLKTEHDAWLSSEGTIPSLPHVTLETLNGLYVESGDQVNLTARHIALFRDHVLCVSATSRHVLRDVRLRVQIRDGLMAHRIAERPAGCEVTFRRVGGEWTAFGTGTASINMGEPV